MKGQEVDQKEQEGDWQGHRDPAEGRVLREGIRRRVRVEVVELKGDKQGVH